MCAKVILYVSRDYLVSPIELFSGICDFLRMFIEPSGAFVEVDKSHLDELMTLESAAQRSPQLFTAIGLRQAARAGQLGWKRFVTEREFVEWLHQKKVGASCRLKNCSNAAVCGSDASTAANNSSGSGTIAEMEKLGAAALRQ
jgi:hypothetical protein